MQQSIKTIDKLENKSVDKALAKHAVDGAPNTYSKKGKKKDSSMMQPLSDDDGYRPTERVGW